jgi:phage-related protein
MAGSRTLKLSILADVDNLRKNLSAGSQEVASFGDKVTDFGKKAGLAFAAATAAAAAYATKLAVDGVKSAMEDEAAQARLATTLENVAGATAATIAQTEAYILKTSLATGVSDTQLRPSLERLARATNDVTEAQRLNNLALDIAAGTGKSLESVSAALARAYDGNTTALSRLGIGLSAAELKSMSFDEVTKALAATFGGQATTQANTYAGQMARLNVAFDEAKETVGVYILQALTPLLNLLSNNIVPAFEKLSVTLGPIFRDVLDRAGTITRDVLVPAFQALWAFVRDYLAPIISNVLQPVFDGLVRAVNAVGSAFKNNQDELTPFYNLLRTIANFVRDFVAPAIGDVLGAALRVVGSLVSTLITNFARLVDWLDDVLSKIREFVTFVRNNPIISGISGVIDRIFGGGRATGGAVTQGTAYIVGERGPELFVPNTSGSIVPNNAIGGSTINVTVNGAIDPESTARQIIQILNNSAYRGTLGAGALV